MTMTRVRIPTRSAALEAARDARARLGAARAAFMASGRPSKSPSAPGSRRTTAFFDDYPRFFETSKTTPYRSRLNLRYDAIFTENREIFAGARVLDIASHDGRWSFAALKSGAASVVGIEARPELVKNAQENMAHYHVAEDRYEFRTGDVFVALAEADLKVDVVLCLGFLYHTLRYSELMHRISGCEPEHLIIDTSVAPNHHERVVAIRAEPVEFQRNAVTDDFSHGDVVLSGAPSIPALRVIGNAYGFTPVGLSDWAGLLRDNPEADHVRDYSRQRRVTMRYRATEDKAATP